MTVIAHVSPAATSSHSGTVTPTCCTISLLIHHVVSQETLQEMFNQATIGALLALPLDRFEILAEWRRSMG